MGSSTSQAQALQKQRPGHVREASEELGSTAGSPTSSISSASSSGSGCAERTLIIFDWDDTLLCSSALDYTTWDNPLMRQLETTVESILRIAGRLGETMIVTNGCATWVQESSKLYLPGLAPVLDSLPIMSARAMYEHLHPSDPASWKRRAFRKILKQKRASGHEGLNLVVLGDQSAEMQAVHCAVKVLRGPSLIKTVKFVEGPSLEQLLGQLRKVTQELGGLVSAENSSSTDLAQRRFPSTDINLEAWATGWTFALGKDWTKFPAVLRSYFDEDEEEEHVASERKDGAEMPEKYMQDWSTHEVLVNDIVQDKSPVEVPVCALCLWGSLPRRSAEDLQIMSI